MAEFSLVVYLIEILKWKIQNKELLLDQFISKLRENKINGEMKNADSHSGSNKSSSKNTE